MMRPTVIIREYDSFTGKIVKLHDPSGFGEILSGDMSGIRTFDFVVTGARDIYDFTISLTGSEGIEVSPPDAVVSGNTADKGNFGIENTATFTIKSSLVRFFAESDLPVSIPMRDSYVTNFIYLNMFPGTYEKVGGIIKYGVNFKYEASASSSSMSSDSSSSNSSGVEVLLYYTYDDYGPVTKPLYFKRIAEECEDKSIIYENTVTDVVVAEFPCDSGTWIILENSILIGINYTGVLGTYSNGWVISES